MVQRGRILRLDTKDEILSEKDNWRLPPVEINDFFDYAKALVGFMGDIANKMHLHGNDWDRTVFIDAGGVRTTEFDLSDDQVNMLINNGQTGVREYFKWFNDPGANPPPRNRV
jgi:NTE family protein